MSELLPNEYFGNITAQNNNIWVPEQSSNQGSLSYPESGNQDLFEIEEESFWFSNRNLLISQLLKKFKFRSPFLDLGGGNGVVSKHLERSGLDTIMIEPGAGALHAKHRGLQCVLQARIEQLSVKKPLPSIGLFDVIEHVESDTEFLIKIAHWQESGGQLILTVPAFSWLWSNDDVYAGHYRRFSKSSINQLLESAGYKTVYTSYFFSYLVPAIFLLKSIPSFLRISAKPNRDRIAQDHKSGSFTQRIFNKFSQWERKSILNERSLPFGSSLVVIAEKI